MNRSMTVEHKGRKVELTYSREFRTFALYSLRGRMIDRLDPKGCHERVAEHNACWVDERHLALLVDAGVVETTGERREFDGCFGQLVRIVHPEFNDAGYSPFGDFSRNRLGMQCQYGSRYVTGRLDGYPALGEGLRFKGTDRGDYHAIEIHRDDMDEFEKRYRAHVDKVMGRA